MSKADQITGAVLLVFSAYVLYQSSQMPQVVDGVPGYGFFPFWLAALFGLLSFFLMLNGRTAATSAGSVSFPAGSRMWGIVVTLLSLGAYAFLLEPLGYVVSTALLVAFLLGVVERENWLVTCFITFVTTAGLYIVFHVFLGISLPVGFLGF